MGVTSIAILKPALRVRNRSGKVAGLSALLLAIGMALSSCNTSTSPKQAPLPQDTVSIVEDSGLIDASLISMLATPERFHGKTVRVFGYLNLAFEGNAIYLHKEDLEHGLYKNGFWVRVPEHLRSEEVNHSYVLLEGRFDMTSHGHMGLWSGTITDITRLEAWR